jgi:hypothetical protein
LTLAAYLAARFPDGLADRVLVFDQFEDVLRIDPTDDAVKDAFFKDVGATLRAAGVRAVFSMREEYVAGLDPYLRHVPTRLASRFRLGLLGPEAAREAVCGPAEAVGVPFRPDAARELVAQLGLVRVQRYDGVVETKPGPTVEPVQLQVVCQLVWDRLPRGATEVGPQVLEGFSVDRALEQYYAAKVKAAAELAGVEEGRVRRWVEKTLITEQRLRGQVLKGTPDTAGLANAAIDGLVGAYLVRSEQRLGGTWFELTHDRLVDPIRQSNRAWFETRLQPFQLQADQWAARPEAERAGLLLNGVALAEAERWAKDHATEVRPTDEAFLEQSRTARTAGDRVRAAVYRWWAVVSTTALVAGVGLLCWALTERYKAVRLSKDLEGKQVDLTNALKAQTESLAVQADLYTQVLDGTAVQASKLATADDPNTVLMAGFAWEQLYKALWPEPGVPRAQGKKPPEVYDRLEQYLTLIRRSPENLNRKTQEELSYALARRLRDELKDRNDPTTVHILDEFRKRYFKAAVEVTQTLANPGLTEEERREAIDSFYQLYWVKLALVEGIDVSSAMVKFKDAIARMTYPDHLPVPRGAPVRHTVWKSAQDTLPALAENLKHACEEELKTTAGGK